jgi:hypothetical protein
MLIERKVFELPTEDQHSLKVIEIGEMKKVQTKFGVKDKFTIKIEVLDQKAEEGDGPIYVFQTFTPSIGEKAQLGKFLRRLGFNTSEGTFEMDDLLGFRFSATIVHNEGTSGNTYANLVIETAKALRGKNEPASKPAPVQPISDEDIPF